LPERGGSANAAEQAPLGCFPDGPHLSLAQKNALSEGPEGLDVDERRLAAILGGRQTCLYTAMPQAETPNRGYRWCVSKNVYMTKEKVDSRPKTSGKRIRRREGLKLGAASMVMSLRPLSGWAAT
jgi:hypothetical protein